MNPSLAMSWLVALRRGAGALFGAVGRLLAGAAGVVFALLAMAAGLLLSVVLLGSALLRGRRALRMAWQQGPRRPGGSGSDVIDVQAHEVADPLPVRIERRR